MEKSRVVVEKCESYDYEDVKKSIEKIFSEFGGISEVVKRGERVLVKPNLLSAHPPEDAVTTHPGVVDVILEKILEQGAMPFIGDSPSVGNLMGVAQKAGIKTVADKYGIPVKELGNTVELNNREGEFKKLEIAKEAIEVDKIINLAKLKTHTQMILTLGVKNMFGVVPGKRKTEWHLRAGTNNNFFASVLLDVYRIAKPVFTIVDGVTGMNGDGPANGNPKKIGLLFGGKDAVSIDKVISHFIGLKDEELFILEAAKKINYGNWNLKDIQIINNSGFAQIENFALPSSIIIEGRLSPFLRNIVVRTLPRPYIDNNKCNLCEICIEACPSESMYVKNNKLRIDYKECISCFCCQENCPSNAIKIKRGLVGKILRKI